MTKTLLCFVNRCSVILHKRGCCGVPNLFRGDHPRSIWKKSALFLSIALTIAMVGCTPGTTAPSSATAPSSVDASKEPEQSADSQKPSPAGREYSITFYWGPEYKDFTAAEVTRMKEAGFDVATIYNFPWGDMSDGEVHYEHLHECVTLLGQQGLNASVNDGRLTQVLTPTATREEIEKAVKRIAEAWKGYDNVTEFYLADEPSANLFPTLKIAVELMREYFPQCTTYINLLPNYATPQMWGTATYEEYVELFASTVGPDYLCTDYYAFLTSVRRDGYAANLETLKNASRKYGLETRLILLCSEHLNAYKNVSREEIAWQANLALLYGMKQLSWYTYAHPVGDPSSKNEMIDIQGNATRHYEEIQAENAINRVLGSALYQTDVQQVFYIGTPVPGLTPYQSYGALGEIAAGSDMLVSFYEDPDIFFLMSQYSDGEEQSQVKSALIPSLQWLNPATAKWEDASACPYVKGDTVTLSAGQAVLFRR